MPIAAAAIRRMRPCRRIERLERRGIDQREIIDSREAGIDERIARFFKDFGDRASAQERRAGGFQRARKRQRLRAAPPSLK